MDGKLEDDLYNRSQNKKMGDQEKQKNVADI